jgi:Na+-transporting NADH:ubiquinone oxidoreductase subunit NqrE
MEKSMFLIFTQLTLVILIGIYAMRASSVLFVRQRFQPLMILAALVFVLALVLFHRPPTEQGAWLSFVVCACFAGAIVNGVLFFAPDRAHGTPTNLVFSAVSGLGWVVLGAAYGSILIGYRVATG